MANNHSGLKSFRENLMLTTDSGLKPGTSQVQSHTNWREVWNTYIDDCVNRKKNRAVKPNSDCNNLKRNDATKNKSRRRRYKKKVINPSEAHDNGLAWMHMWNLYTDFVHKPSNCLEPLDFEDPEAAKSSTIGSDEGPNNIIGPLECTSQCANRATTSNNFQYSNWSKMWNLYMDFVHKPIAPTRKRVRKYIQTNKAVIPQQSLEISAINEKEKHYCPPNPLQVHTGRESITSVSSNRTAESKFKIQHNRENQKSKNSKRRRIRYSRNTLENRNQHRKLASSKEASNFEIQKSIHYPLQPLQDDATGANKTPVTNCKNMPSQTISNCSFPTENIASSPNKHMKNKQLENGIPVSSTIAVESNYNTNIKHTEGQQSKNSKRRPRRRGRKTPGNDNHYRKLASPTVASNLEIQKCINPLLPLQAGTIKIPVLSSKDQLLKSISNCSEISPLTSARVNQKCKTSRKRSQPKPLNFKTQTYCAGLSSTVDRNNTHSGLLRNTEVNYKVYTTGCDHLWNLYLDFVPIKNNSSKSVIALKICPNSTQKADTCMQGSKNWSHLWNLYTDFLHNPKADTAQLEYVAIDCEMVEVGGKFRRQILARVSVVDQQDEVLLDTAQLEYVAIDCEMVEVGGKFRRQILARVSVVDQQGEVLLDKFVKPSGIVTNYRTEVSGIRPHDIENGENFELVRNEVAQLIKNKIIVGHGLHHDLEVLNITHPLQTGHYDVIRQMEEHPV